MDCVLPVCNERLFQQEAVSFFSFCIAKLTFSGRKGLVEADYKAQRLSTYTTPLSHTRKRGLLQDVVPCNPFKALLLFDACRPAALEMPSAGMLGSFPPSLKCKHGQR